MADRAADDIVDVTTLSTPDLEDRLTSLAARIAAAECEFLLLLAEFDAREGWGRCGMRSPAHWLSWRTGMRLGVARERVRVARALRRLPLVRAAFAEGRLSYCKVRAISRVATAPTEEELVDVALGATGAQLERIVRSWRTCLEAETGAWRHLRRQFRRREEDDGSVVFTVRLAPEEAAVIDSAMAAARVVVLDDDGSPVETPEEAALAAAVTDQPAAVRADADAFVLVAESFLATGPRGAPGDSTLVMVHADLDALAQAAEDVSAETSPDSASAAESDPGAPLEQRVFARRPAGSTTDGGHRIPASTVLRMLCQSPAQLMVHARDGRPLDLGRTRRHASLKQRRALRVRDGGCRFPGCTRRHRLIPHHVVWWTRGGRTDLDLLVLVCPTHHRAVHEVGYAVTALGAGRFAWFRPRGEQIPEAPEAPEVSCVSPDVPVTPDTIVPTWGGGRLDLDHLVSGLAGNVLTAAGYRPMDVPYAEQARTLRRAAGWPEPDSPPPWTVDPAA